MMLNKTTIYLTQIRTNLAQSSPNSGQCSADVLRRSQRNRRPVIRFGRSDN